MAGVRGNARKHYLVRSQNDATCLSSGVANISLHCLPRVFVQARLFSKQVIRRVPFGISPSNTVRSALQRVLMGVTEPRPRVNSFLIRMNTIYDSPYVNLQRTGETLEWPTCRKLDCRLYWPTGFAAARLGIFVSAWSVVIDTEPCGCWWCRPVQARLSCATLSPNATTHFYYS